MEKYRLIPRVVSIIYCFLLLYFGVNTVGSSEIAKQDENINVRRFGAVGNGRDDDRPAIQKALDEAARSGGVVIIPRGDYLLIPPAKGGPILLIGSGVTLQGEGPSSRLVLPSRLPVYGSALGVISNRHFLPGSKNAQIDVRDHDIIIRNLAIDAGASEEAQRLESAYHGIMLVGVDRVSVENCEIRNTQGKWSGTPSDGIYITSTSTARKRPGLTSRYVTISNCLFENIGRDGITVVDGQHIKIINNRIEKAHTRVIAKEGGDFGVGIDLEPNYSDQLIDDILVQGNRVTDCYAGISADHKNGPGIGYRVTFSGNYVSRSKSFGLRFYHIDECVMERNTVEDCGNEGIIIKNTTRATVRENTLTRNAIRRPTVVPSVRVEKSKRISFIDNVITPMGGSKPILVLPDASNVTIR